MLLSVIIVSYNTHDLTQQTLESVLREIDQSHVLKGRTEVIVIDNNSTDNTPILLKKYQTQHANFFHIILNKNNLGFSSANNQGIQEAKSTYLLLLNSDTIVQPGSIEKLVEAFEENPIDDTTSALSSRSGRLDRLGVLAATLLNPDGSIQRQGGSFPTLLSVFVHMLFLDDIPIIGRFLPSTQHTGKSRKAFSLDQKKKLAQQDWVGGTAMMLRSAMIEEIGGLDENIFMYSEDVELCMRAKHHHWDIAIHPDAPITHFGSASSSATHAIIGEYKGFLYIWAKHKPIWQRPILKGILWLGASLRVLLFKHLLHDEKRAHPYVSLLKDVLR